MICIWCRWYDEDLECCTANFENDEDLKSARCCQDDNDELCYINKGGDDNE